MNQDEMCASIKAERDSMKDPEDRKLSGDRMTSERRVARFRMSPKLLREAIHMPETAEVYGLEWNLRDDLIIVYVRDDTLPGVHEGDPVPMTHLLVAEHTKIAKDENGFECVCKSYEGKWS